MLATRLAAFGQAALRGIALRRHRILACCTSVDCTGEAAGGGCTGVDVGGTGVGEGTG